MGKFGFSFSWRRALGLSAAKARLSRAIGMPLTRAGQERRVGQAVMGRTGAVPLLLFGGTSGVLGCLGRIVRLVLFIGLITGAVLVYRHFKSDTDSSPKPATAPAKPAPADPTFEDILKQHSEQHKVS